MAGPRSVGGREAFHPRHAACAAFALPAAAQDHPLDGVWEGAYECAKGART
jgi:hypothetical protein